MEAQYTTEALSTGAGRSGKVQLADGSLSFDMTPPKEMGGSGKGVNPEQLFACGYAACYHQALISVASSHKVKMEDETVGTKVSIGDNGKGGFQLAVALEVVIPNVDHDTAQTLADEAHQVCPYSNATRGNIEVTVTVSDD
ncbi:MAG: organic hydroperoxide resistance protein [Ancrocorticia sp.]|uniref:organic hydroperoxide resistance protein n=1 Tax=Ancrocorticia sp. TaxID=2593684 RepID=UPI003F92C8CA